MGRNAIYLAIGFTILCLLSGLNLSRVSVGAFSNAIAYQENSNLLNIAETGTNFAANQLFTTPNWRTGFQNVPFGGGTFSVAVNMVVNRIPIRAGSRLLPEHYIKRSQTQSRSCSSPASSQNLLTFPTMNRAVSVG